MPAPPSTPRRRRRAAAVWPLSLVLILSDGTREPTSARAFRPSVAGPGPGRRRHSAAAPTAGAALASLAAFALAGSVGDVTPSVPSSVPSSVTSSLTSSVPSSSGHAPGSTSPVETGILRWIVPAASAAPVYTGNLSAEQLAVAEAWRTVDNSFLDRTFNHQDWFELRQKYVTKQKYKTMEEAQVAIGEMVGTLGDKYTRYLTPQKYQSMVDAATGNLVGIGCEIAPGDNGRIRVSDVQPDSPAQAVIKRGDVFVAVDGTRFDAPDPNKPYTPDDVATRLRGGEGTRVSVTVQRDAETLDFLLSRRKVTVLSVRPYTTTSPALGKVGVIKIKSFSGTTAKTVQDTLDAQKGAAATVLDLRGNPGGLLPGGVETASLFLPNNSPVVYTINNKGAEDKSYSIQEGVDLERPLVIVVDSNTASAAEVLTAALQENNRAVVVGDAVDRTFGKGIVQTIRQLGDDNGGVAITVARYETPKRNDINKRGIEVDLKMEKLCVEEDVVKCLPLEAFKKK